MRKWIDLSFTSFHFPVRTQQESIMTHPPEIQGILKRHVSVLMGSEVMIRDELEKTQT